MTEHEWHLVDADNKVLGRVATEVASLLIGKHRPDFAPNRVAPVHVVVTNSDTVALTGSKEEDKNYYHYTGHPGGLRQINVQRQREKDSRKIIELAVQGMLPKNNLRAKRMLHLKVYPGAEHPHMAQFNAN